MNIKLKRGRVMVYKGQEVKVYSDKQNGEVMICMSLGMELDAAYENVRYEDLKEPQGGRTAIASKPKPKANKPALDVFFEEVAKKMPFNCENCGRPLYANTKFAKRCVSAHILPKAQFSSVASNVDNVMFLGAGLLGVCYCHDNYDNKGAKDRAEMPCYKIALERFKKFYHELNNHELSMALKYLNNPKKYGN